MGPLGYGRGLIGWTAAAGLLASLAWAQELAAPLRPDFEETAEHRRLDKPVRESRRLDAMESLDAWAQRGEGQMSLTAERRRGGAHALRMQCKTQTAADPQIRGRREFGRFEVVRRFAGEDWSAYNRLSFWIFPDLPGWHTASFDVSLRNDPDVWTREAWNSLTLRNHAWNHVVWEIAHLDRKKVIGVQFRYRQQGHEREAADTVTFDLDDLELQRVDADWFEGWSVAPGHVAFSHSGYTPGAPKTAIAGENGGREFRILRRDSGQTVLSRPAVPVQTRLGRFRVLDFSELREPGEYILETDGIRTPTFRIGDDVWTSSVRKVLNFFQSQRCGVEVPGVHRVCHRDWRVTHGDRSIVINGGWHDAGDLSQVTANTAEAVIAMLETSERLRARDEDRTLQGRLAREAKTGLDWILKTSFGDGYRVQWAMANIWSNGIIGDNDDMLAEAQNIPFENSIAASAEAAAARILRDTDPDLAGYSLKKAAEDWRFTVEALNRPLPESPIVPGTLITNTLVTATAIQASIELFRATGEPRYADKALELAPRLLASQQKAELARGSLPAAGFFYETPEKRKILHYVHRAHDQAPVLALARLCETFPRHPDWIQWYSAVALFSNYLEAAAAFSAPYGMLANSVYKEDEYLQAPEKIRESYRRQLENGIAVAPGFRLRLFPVWFSDRGNNGILLSQAKALVLAARLRGKLSLAEMAQRQMEWIAGRNPFAQSILYGEGHDFAPHYSAMSGQIVGSITVGIETRDDRDVPYWPDTSFPTWKETWTHACSRWLWLAGDLSGPAIVKGRVTPAAEIRFRDLGSGKATAIRPDAAGQFRFRLPQGRYEVTAAGQRRTVELLPGGVYDLDLRPAHNLDLELSAQTGEPGAITLTARVTGTGSHRLTLLADNLEFSEPAKSVELDGNGARTVSWRCRVRSLSTPWVAVVISDGDLGARSELVSYSL